MGIKTAMLSQFYITQLVVNATGEVDHLIRTTAITHWSISNARRVRENHDLRIYTSSVVNTVAGERNGVEANRSDAEVSGALHSAVSYCLMISTRIAYYT